MTAHRSGGRACALACAIPVALAAVARGGPAAASPVPQGTGEATRTDLPSRVNLARLVDLAASQAGTHVEYSPTDLEKVTVAVRLTEGLDPAALWDLANQLLAQNGLTTVRLPGAATLSVVRLADAAALARIEDPGAEPPDPPAGFESRLVELPPRASKEELDALKLVLSRPGGAANPVGDGRRAVVSDLRPRVDQAEWLLRRLDVEGEPPVIERIATTYLPATQVAAMVTAAAEAQRPLMRRPPQGTLRVAASGDDATLLLVAPREDAAFFRALVDEFDRRAEVRTETYSPKGFELDEVATLLEGTARDAGPRGSGDRWRVVRDTLSGTLVVTATPAEHEAVRAAMDRLELVPPQARVPVRTYPIRNRSVDEVVQLIQQLVGAGVLAADTSFAGETPFDAAAASQRSTRDVLPPGAVPVVPPGAEAPGSQAPSAAASRATAARGAAGTGAGNSSSAPSALSITADPATNTLIAAGEPRVLAQLEALLRTIDVRQPQVMLEVLVLSVSDSEALDLGIELETLIQSGDTFIRLASLFGLGPIPLVPPVGGTVPIPTGMGGTALVLNPGDYGVLVRALEKLNGGRTLNVPKLLVNNNEQGTLDATLQVPYLSTNASSTVATTSFGGSESAGTTVTIRPQIAAGDHMRLEYAVALSTFVGDSTDPALPPPKQENSLESVVTIPDGHTVALGGLEIRTETEAVTQVPFLGDVPGLGELFKNRSKGSSRNRFYVFITPQVLRRDGFEDLRHISSVELRRAGLDDSFPKVLPQVVR